VYHAICITQGSSSSSFDLRLLFRLGVARKSEEKAPERLIIIIIIQTVAPAERCTHTHTTLETDRNNRRNLLLAQENSNLFFPFFFK
jgi:hypothetical protein